MVPIPQDATVGTLRAKVEARLPRGRRLVVGGLATQKQNALLSDNDIVSEVCESNEVLVVVDDSKGGAAAHLRSPVSSDSTKSPTSAGRGERGTRPPAGASGGPAGLSGSRGGSGTAGRRARRRGGGSAPPPSSGIGGSRSAGVRNSSSSNCAGGSAVTAPGTGSAENASFTSRYGNLNSMGPLCRGLLKPNQTPSPYVSVSASSAAAQEEEQEQEAHRSVEIAPLSGAGARGRAASAGAAACCRVSPTEPAARLAQIPMASAALELPSPAASGEARRGGGRWPPLA